MEVFGDFSVGNNGCCCQFWFFWYWDVECLCFYDWCFVGYLWVSVFLMQVGNCGLKGFVGGLVSLILDFVVNLLGFLLFGL